MSRSLYWTLVHRKKSLSEKCTAALELISYTVVNAAFVAILLDLQYPSDDGSCSDHETEDACVNVASVFDVKEKKCSWYQGIPGQKSNECHWNEPSFGISSVMILMFISILITSPVYAALDITFREILRAPSRTRQRKRAGSIVPERLDQNSSGPDQREIIEKDDIEQGGASSISLAESDESDECDESDESLAEVEVVGENNTADGLSSKRNLIAV